MNEYNKKYQSLQIPKRTQDSKPSNPTKGNMPTSSTQDAASESFYEIEYDSCPLPGVGKFVLKSQKIETPEKDEIRELFYQMREIAREDRFLNYHVSKFYDKKAQQENARVFYKQGMFMKDFEDTNENQVPFSSYFPNYQMMGYDQLRTYFTWRTRIRKGEITNTSLSYAFLYIYELINNIGVDNPQDGLEKLMSFWNAFRVYDQAIDKYVIKWLKDYHIYYDLPWSFKEFITEYHLGAHYPKVVNPNDNFDLYCSISKYDIRKSKFYNDDTVGLIRDCFDYVIHRIRETFSEKQILLDDLLFQPTKNMAPWIPFREALFYPGLRHPDKRVILSEKEIYIRSQNKWMFHTTITTESGKQLVGYILKQMEAVLRKSTNYKYKLSAEIHSLSSITADVLSREGISLEHLVTEATLQFYRESTKTVVKVDPEALTRIRQEALMTQERLIIPEQMPESDKVMAKPDNPAAGIPQLPYTLATDENLTTKQEGSAIDENLTTKQEGSAIDENLATKQEGSAIDENLATKQEGSAANKNLTTKQEGSTTNENLTTKQEGSAAAEQAAPITIAQDGQFTFHPEMLSAPSIMESLSAAVPSDTSSDPWESLRNAFNDLEQQALLVLWQNQAGNATSQATSITQFALKHNIMPEVLIDGINEKAMDFIGDNLLDGEFIIYEDYIEQVKGMVERIWQHKYPQE